MILLVIGMLLLHTITADTSHRRRWTPTRCIFGLGLGFNMQTLVLAIQNAVPPQDMGVATSSATFFRQMGGTLGTAVFLSVLFNALPGKIASAFGASALDPAVPVGPARPGRAQQPGQRAGARDAQGRRQRRLDGGAERLLVHQPRSTPGWPGRSWSASRTRSTWCSCSARSCIAVALVIVWFLPEEKLRTQSGLQAQQTQAREAAATRSEVPHGAVDAGGAAAMVPGAGSTDTPEAAREAAEEEPVAPDR